MASCWYGKNRQPITLDWSPVFIRKDTPSVTFNVQANINLFCPGFAIANFCSVVRSCFRKAFEVKNATMSAPVNPTAPPSYDEATVMDPAYPPPQPQYQGQYPPQEAYPQGSAAYPPGEPYPPAQGAYPPGEAYPPSSGYSAPPPAQAPPPATSYGSATGDVEGGFTAARSLSDKDVRRKFIMKVYLILTLQLAVTFGTVCLFFFVEPVRTYVLGSPGLYWASYGVFLVVYIVLACCGEFRRKTPHNYIALTIFTISLSYLTGTIACTYYETGGQTVLIALAITGGVTVGVTLFSIQTKYDFTSCGGFLFIFSWSLFLFGFIAIFTYSQILYTVYAWLAALLFTLFLAYDTQLLIGGRRFELSPEEYIFGALNLYIDVVYLFLIILSLFGGSR
ncbi:protein lifeguard 2-like isoform X2 [Asterias amurensis]|uniref:protein lifeguard 2-like isoform X2 n=1 Tax=Asterias amurensis TaxID=7602 RepID=UPI003AB53283